MRLASFTTPFCPIPGCAMLLEGDSAAARASISLTCKSGLRLGVDALAVQCFTLRVPAETNARVILADTPVIDRMANFQAIRQSFAVQEVDAAQDYGYIQDLQ